MADRRMEMHKSSRTRVLRTVPDVTPRRQSAHREDESESERERVRESKRESEREIETTTYCYCETQDVNSEEPHVTVPMTALFLTFSLSRRNERTKLVYTNSDTLSVLKHGCF